MGAGTWFPSLDQLSQGRARVLESWGPPQGCQGVPGGSPPSNVPIGLSSGTPWCGSVALGMPFDQCPNWSPHFIYLGKLASKYSIPQRIGEDSLQSTQTQQQWLGFRAEVQISYSSSQTPAPSRMARKACENPGCWTHPPPPPPSSPPLHLNS